MKIYGIAFIKNGVKFDYPFKESLYSLLPLVEKIYINVGISDDGTLEEIKKIPKVEIIEVDWETNRSDNGYIFSEMTNIAISKMREDVTEEDAWAIYLQSDEVIHEDDYEQIKNDLKQADEEGCDVVKMNYMHFWQTHSKIATGKNWYPQEIRAFKVKSDVVNYADAQSFSQYKKVFLSNAFIWHYGHVRDEKAYKEKNARQRRYHESGFKLYRKSFKRIVRSILFPEKTKAFTGKHPKVMHDRIERFGK